MVMGDLVREVDVVVIGGGPGGYSAAFRCAELGLETVVVDAGKRLGGACLFEGCIPSKALLHVAAVLGEAERAKEFGVDFGEPRISLDPLRKWKTERVIGKLARGLASVARGKNVEVVGGRAVFEDGRSLRVQGDEPQTIRFKHAIVATGSRPAPLPGLELTSERILDSTAALELPEIPERLLVIGGGYIGLELGKVYAALGSQVTLVEMTDGLLPGVDRDLVAAARPAVREDVRVDPPGHPRGGPARGRRQRRGALGRGQPPRSIASWWRSAAGRRRPAWVSRQPGPGSPNADSSRWTSAVARPIRTCGRWATPPASRCWPTVRCARARWRPRRSPAGRSRSTTSCVPAVVFTDPEIAWCGLTETAAAAAGRAVKVARFAWAASGRAATLGRSDGVTKLLVDPDTGRVLGVGLVGPGAGELIAEGALAVETALLAEDLALTIHTHPTLSETLMEAAETLLH